MKDLPLMELIVWIFLQTLNETDKSKALTKSIQKLPEFNAICHCIITRSKKKLSCRVSLDIQYPRICF